MEPMALITAAWLILDFSTTETPVKEPEEINMVAPGELTEQDLKDWDFFLKGD